VRQDGTNHQLGMIHEALFRTGINQLRRDGNESFKAIDSVHKEVNH